MSDETATNPVEGGESAPETEVETEGQETETEQQFDDDGNPIDPEPEEDDSEEIEHEGQKYKVPKAIKPLVMMQADYTRKTQEVADLRKAVEAERQTLHQSSEAEIAARATVVALDQQLAQFQNIDWDAWEDQDPFAAQKGLRQYQQLRDARGQAAGQFVALQQQRNLEAQRTTAKRLEEGRAALARDIPGWSDTLAASLLETGAKHYGFERGEIEDSFDDPRLIKVLHDAHQYQLSKGKQKQAQKHVAAQQVQPAAKVGARSAPPSGLDDRLPTDEWMRRREAQLRKRG
jgi:hypothetical protein